VRSYSGTPISILLFPWNYPVTAISPFIGVILPLNPKVRPQVSRQKNEHVDFAPNNLWTIHFPSHSARWSQIYVGLLPLCLFHDHKANKYWSCFNEITIIYLNLAKIKTIKSYEYMIIWRFNLFIYIYIYLYTHSLTLLNLFPKPLMPPDSYNQLTDLIELIFVTLVGGVITSFPQLLVGP